MRRLLPAVLLTSALLTSCTSGGEGAARPNEPTTEAPSPTTEASSSNTSAPAPVLAPATNADWDAAAAKLPAAPRTVDVYLVRDGDRDAAESGQHIFHAAASSACAGSGWFAPKGQPVQAFTFGDGKEMLNGDFVDPLVPHDICNVVEQVGAVLDVTETATVGTNTRLVGRLNPEKIKSEWAKFPDAVGTEGSTLSYAETFSTVELLLDEEGIPRQLELRADRPEGDPNTVVLVFNPLSSTS